MVLDDADLEPLRGAMAVCITADGALKRRSASSFTFSGVEISAHSFESISLHGIHTRSYGSSGYLASAAPLMPKLLRSTRTSACVAFACRCQIIDPKKMKLELCHNL
ncbi:hypothetical protein ZWY2020_008220 [Hordeum vulgare]|nr:hypothetical protein ZWY2020_008220 [Hordeum vulgare]